MPGLSNPSVIQLPTKSKEGMLTNGKLTSTAEQPSLQMADQIHNHQTQLENQNNQFPIDSSIILPDDLDRLELFDVIGIGFGPSNLAIGVNLAEENLNASNIHPRSRLDSHEQASHETKRNGGLKTCFIESNPCFRWHPGMMVSPDFVHFPCLTLAPHSSPPPRGGPSRFHHVLGSFLALLPSYMELSSSLFKPSATPLSSTPFP